MIYRITANAVILIHKESFFFDKNTIFIRKYTSKRVKYKINEFIFIFEREYLTSSSRLLTSYCFMLLAEAASHSNNVVTARVCAKSTYKLNSILLQKLGYFLKIVYWLLTSDIFLQTSYISLQTAFTLLLGSS